MRRFLGRSLPLLLGTLLLLTSAGCVSNVWNCPEDIGEREHCPTDKEEQQMFVILLVLLNTGHAPPGQIR